MNTDRVYDVSGWTALLAALVMAVAWALALSSPAWAINDSDVSSAWVVVALATLMCAIVLYGWAFGTRLYKPLPVR